jgi:hypothetical protein
MRNLYSATVCFAPGNEDPAAGELAELEARLHSLGAINPEAMLDQRTGTVHVRFNVAADVAKIATLIDALAVELADARSWTLAGIAYYQAAASG